METLLVGLIVLVIGNTSLLWYRIGRLEGRLTKVINGAKEEDEHDAS
ncbi:hypothetical protein LCGC14_0758360 [marine sediment metagenome]|uniref:Uncharacterized protein n=1 Tax=marine sediment metagenome TaxID=412755 RepID=A0A0F9Q620_9ZZZZ